ncbi:MAG: AMP-binding protein, partial [Candidatus Omnitrophica bacterium]|nr:AMP-binding protein [Candidatus Omnitrophota bacterium]
MNDNFSIIWAGRQIKSPQLFLYVASAVKYLKNIGIEASDRIVLCANTSVEYVIVLLALWQMKVITAPVNPRWPTQTITSYASRINARRIFNASDIKQACCFDPRQQVEAGLGLLDFDLTQQVTIMATSASSGEPKAVLHTWGNHFYSAQGSNELIPLKTTDRWLLSLPLYHISGIAIVVRCLLAGAGLVIGGPEEIVSTMERGKVSHVSLVSTQLHRFLNDDKTNKILHSLKCILLGGSAISSKVIERCADLGLNVYLSYGLTEMCSQVATGRVCSNGKSAVKVLAWRQLSIYDREEILVKGEV